MVCQRKSDDWNCCFRKLQIQVAAVVIGICHFIVCLIMLIVLIVTLYYQIKTDGSFIPKLNLFSSFQNDDSCNDSGSGNNGTILEGFLASLLLILVMGLSLLMINGSINKKPWYLIPFFFWQLLDLILIITFIALLSLHMQEIRPSNTEEKLRVFNSLYLDLYDLLMIILIAFTFLKIYAVILVWRCFKYISKDKGLKEKNSNDSAISLEADCMEPTPRYQVHLSENMDKDLYGNDGCESYDEADDCSILETETETTIFINEYLRKK